jgi:Family of unknown function (DUF6516)
MKKPQSLSQVEKLLERETFELKAKNGGGVLSYEVWGYESAEKTVVTRYNLAYINAALYGKDNGRVLGFDNAHGFHHRHFKGKVQAVEFTDYESIFERFQSEWLSLIKGELTS